VEFFQEWLARSERSQVSESIDTAARRRAIERAKEFWQERLAQAE
jgi:hypothetical protein